MGEGVYRTGSSNQMEKSNPNQFPQSRFDFPRTDGHKQIKVAHVVKLRLTFFEVIFL